MSSHQDIINGTNAIIETLCRLEQPKFQEIVSNIKPGSFNRIIRGQDYQDRLIYTKEFRRFIYNPAVLNEIFSQPELKHRFFRTFGYKGSTDFTIYPNCWLRDLPLLDIGKDTYLGDGVLLGTNQVSQDQKTLKVGTIKIGERCVFDQHCKVGYNSVIGNDCIIGIQTAIGLKCKMGDNVKLGEATTVRHGVMFENNVTIGAETQIGNFSIFEEGVTLPEFSRVPSFSLVTPEGIFDRKAIRKRA